MMKRSQNFLVSSALETRLIEPWMLSFLLTDLSSAIFSSICSFSSNNSVISMVFASRISLRSSFSWNLVLKVLCEKLNLSQNVYLQFIPS